MKTRIIVGVIGIPLLFLTLVCLPPISAGVVTGVIAAISVWELRHALGAERSHFDIPYSLLAFCIPFAISIEADSSAGTVVMFLSLAVVFAEYIWRYEKGQDISLTRMFGSIFAVIILPYALSSVAMLRVFGGRLGRAYVLAPFISAFLTDAGAYFVGIFFGKRKAFPRVSPKKTVAGCVGGIVTGVAAMFLYWFILTLIYEGLEFPVIRLLITGTAGAAATIFGDLAFSLIKRITGIKDYGNVLPGHGGMLDRFDSLVFAAPVIALIITVCFPVL